MADIAIPIARPKVVVQRPSMWTCIFVNDDYTPMEFVTELLIKLFNCQRSDALQIMLKVHHEGKAAVGSYPKDISFLKADQAMATAGAYEYPLQVIPTELKTAM